MTTQSSGLPTPERQGQHSAFAVADGCARLSSSELLRLACIYAEQDREAYLDAWSNCNDPSDMAVRKETADFLKQLRAYRKRRWGKSRRDRLDEAPTVPVSHNNPDQIRPEERTQLER